MGQVILGGDAWTFADPETVCLPPHAPRAAGPLRLRRAMLADALRLVRRATRAPLEEVRDLWHWLTHDDALLTLTDCCEALGLDAATIRRGMLEILTAQPVTASPFPVVAPLVPHPPKIRPGWIHCPRCLRVAAVHDVIRTTLCAPCGRRSVGYYARRKQRRAARAVA